MTECDDEYWSHPDPSQAFKQPPGKPSTVAFCNAFIRLLKIQALASRTIVSSRDLCTLGRTTADPKQFTINKSKLLLGYVGPEWKQRIVAELDSSMNRWLDTVPAHCEYITLAFIPHSSFNNTPAASQYAGTRIVKIPSSSINRRCSTRITTNSKSASIANSSRHPVGASETSLCPP